MIDWGGQRLLIVAPHPDDEVIGAGGLICKVKDAGGEVHVLYLTVGDTKDASPSGQSSANERKDEIEAVAQLLGFDGYDIVFEGAQFHLRLDVLAQVELIEAIESSGSCSIRELEPTVVVLPHLASYNQDHRAAARATMSATRPGDAAFRFQPNLVLAYEQVADQWHIGSAFDPTLYVELSDAQVQAKVDAMRAYKSQHRDHPSNRSAEGLASLATVRGAQSGHVAAEAFECLRWRA